MPNKVTDIEAMIDMWPSSQMFGKPFGVKIHRGNSSSRYTNFGLALCANLTDSQRRFVKDIQRQSSKAYEEVSKCIIRKN